MAAVWRLAAVLAVLCCVYVSLRQSNQALREATQLSRATCPSRSRARQQETRRGWTANTGRAVATTQRKADESLCTVGNSFVGLDFPYACDSSGIFAIVQLFGPSLPDDWPSQAPNITAFVALDHTPRVELASFVALRQLEWIVMNDASQGSVPSELGLLSNLVFVHIAHQSASTVAPLPSQIGLLTQLEVLELYDCQISSPLPAQLYSLSQLTSIDLSANSHLTLDSELGLLTALRLLQIPRSDATGALHTQLGLLTQLVGLELTGSLITGPIPSQLGALSELTKLRIAEMQLWGSIPTQVGLLTSLSRFDVDNNALEGTIPTQLGLLTRVTSLSLHVNKLTGTVPSELGLLANLTDFMISNNSLGGTLPSQLALLPALTKLAVAHNDLSGTLPDFNQTLTWLACDYSGLVDVECAQAAPEGDFPAPGAVISLLVLAVLVVLAVFATAGFVWRHRTHEAIRSLPPRFSYLMLFGMTLLGCGVVALAVAMLDVDTDLRTGGCIALPVFASLSTVITFGAIATRSFPLWRKVIAKETEGVKSIPSVAIVGAITALDAFLVPSIALHSRAGQNAGCEVDNEADMVYIHHTYVASVVLVALWLVFRIRRAHDPNGDTARLSKATLLMALFVVILGVLAFTAEEQLLVFVSVAMLAVLSVTTLLALVFVPKFVRVLRRPTSSSMEMM